MTAQDAAAGGLPTMDEAGQAAWDETCRLIAERDEWKRRAEWWKEACRFYRWLSGITGVTALTHREKRQLYRGSRR